MQDDTGIVDPAVVIHQQRKECKSIKEYGRIPVQTLTQKKI